MGCSQVHCALCIHFLLCFIRVVARYKERVNELRVEDKYQLNYDQLSYPEQANVRLQRGRWPPGKNSSSSSVLRNANLRYARPSV